MHQHCSFPNHDYPSDMSGAATSKSQPRLSSQSYFNSLLPEAPGPVSAAAVSLPNMPTHHQHVALMDTKNIET